MPLVRSVILVLVLICCARPVSAQDLYALNFVTDELYVIDTTTGAATLVGPFGTDLSGGGAAFDVSGTMWGLLRNPSAGSDDLYTIDISTGAVTHVVAADRIFRSRGIVFGPDGTTLYASSSGGGSDDDLYTIDTSTGVTTHIGVLGLPTTTASLTGATGYGNWCLAGTDLYSVDLNTAATTLIGTALGSATLAFNPLDGYLYLVGSSNLFRVDPTTAATTLVGPLGVAGGGWSASAFPSTGTIAVEARAWSEIKALFR